MVYPIFLILLCLPLVNSNSVRKIRGLSKTPPQSANVRSATLKTLIRHKKKLAYNKRKAEAAALKIANAAKGQQKAIFYMNEIFMSCYDCECTQYTDIYDYFFTKFGNDIDSNKYFYNMFNATNIVYGHAKLTYYSAERKYNAALIIAQDAQRTSNTAEINLIKATEEAKNAKQLLVKANKDVINAACILNIDGAACIAAENMHVNALKKAKEKVQS